MSLIVLLRHSSTRLLVKFSCQLYFGGLSDFLNSLFLKIICVCTYVHKYVSCSTYEDVRTQLVEIGPFFLPCGC